MCVGGGDVRSVPKLPHPVVVQELAHVVAHTICEEHDTPLASLQRFGSLHRSNHCAASAATCSQRNMDGPGTSGYGNRCGVWFSGDDDK